MRATLSRLVGFLERSFQRTWVRVLFGLGTVASALILRLLLQPLTGHGAPFVLFFGAALVSSLVAGAGVGLLVLLLSLPLGAIMFAMPAGATPHQAAFQALLYGLDGLIVIHLTRLTRNARRRARDIIELAPEAYFQATLDGRLVDVNRAACELVGYQRSELVGKAVLDLLPPEEAPRFMAVRQELLTPGAVHTGEWTLRHKTGAPVTIESGSNILPGGRWQAFARDIAERKRGEAERQRTTELLRQSEEQFRLVFEEAPIGVTLASLDGRFVRVNKALCEMLGYSAAELEQLSYQEITAREDLPASLRLRQQVLRGEVPKYRIEKRYVRKGGSKVDVCVNGAVVHDAEGAPLHYIAHVEDITERRRAEEAARQSELNFRRLVETMPDSVFLHKNERVVYANPTCVALLGFERAEDLLGRWIYDFIDPSLVESVRARVRAMKGNGGSAQPQEVTLRRRDGTPVVIESVGLSTRFEGEPAIVVVMRDITARKRLEREQRLLAEVGVALAASLDHEETLATVARLAVKDFADWCMVEITERTGELRRLKVVSADPATADLATRLERFPLDRGRPYLTRAVVESRQPLVISRVTAQHLEAAAQSAEHLAALAAIGATSLLSVPLLLRGSLLGTLTFISTTPHRLYGAEDLRFARALAERAAVAIENARLYREALSATGLRDQVLGVVAHDLRNPLSTIALHATALGRMGPQPDRRNPRHKDAIERATRRMARLIQDLLDVAVLEGGQLKVERSPLSPGDLLAEAVEMQQELAAASSIELRVQLAPELPRILGDHDRLLQVFENLIGNALKFTEAGGRVVVGAARGDHEALFWVADTGRGMTAEDLARVFDRFWQASARSGRLGAGLGLPITKGIIEAHGGRIWAESAPGQGSTFFFALPAGASANEAASLIH